MNTPFLKYVVVLLAIVAVAVPTSAFAISQKADDFVYIGPEEEIDDNLIVFADSSADIEGTIKGDLIVAAGVANIKGTVEGDIIAAGGDISISGSVGGDVRVFAGTVVIDSVIGGNVTAMSGKLVLGDDAEIGHSVSGFTGLYEGNGAVVKNVTLAAGEVSINGPVGRNVQAHIDQQGRLLLLSNARIGGDVYYSAKNKIESVPGAEVAGIITKISTGPGGPKDFPAQELLFFFKFVTFLAAVVVGLLFINLFPKATKEVADGMIAEPLKMVLFGFAYFFLIPLILILVMMTIIGIPLAILLFMLYFGLLYLSKIFAALAIGLMITNKTATGEVSLFFPLIFGILILYIVVSIPLIGWLVGALLTWWGLSGAIQWAHTKYKQAT